MSKLKAGATRVLTANDLLTGDVVFLTAAGAWSRVLDEARIAETKAAAAALEDLATTPKIEAATVGAYVIDVERAANGGLRPLRTREKIRVSGPSILAAPAPDPILSEILLHPRRSAPATPPGLGARPAADIAPPPSAVTGDEHVSL